MRLPKRRFPAARQVAGVVLVFVAVPIAWSCKPSGPRVDVLEPTAQVGRVIRGQTIDQSFTLRNVGTAPLRLTGVDLACSCQAVPGFSREIPPGQSETIQMRVSTDRLPEGRQKGLAMRIQTNDPAAPSIEFAIDAEIHSEFLVSEDWLDFGTVQQGSDVSRKFVVGVAAHSDSRVLGASSTDPAVNVAVRSKSGKGRQVEVTVIASQRTTAPVGSHFGNVIVQTSSQYMPELRVPIFGTIVAWSGSGRRDHGR
jgi:hypothetical protein